MIKMFISTHYWLIVLISFSFVLLLSGFSYKKMTKNTNNITVSSNFYDLKAVSIDGQEISFEKFRGKKVLIVNVASKCGYTYQYEGLQKLHELYGDKVSVLGFPANDFLFQESGSNEEIAEFCENSFGVTFQMFEKITTKGRKQSPVYHWLSNKELNGWNDQKPSWNFCKYIIDEDGKLVAFFDSKVKPLSKEIVSLIK
ncbi:MAG: glutathione peroxidase [Candidatus Neomarinimicrobiota bacterium]|nr:glutathione peroxidase [Candidatus Neomarinimicrobiota bacterium]